jgi:type I restriction enzyme S subunit
MEVRKGYKQTDFGVIPEDWDTPRIDNVCKLINGRGFKPFEWKTAGLPIIRIQNLNGSDEFNYFNGTYDKKLEVDTGQLLFAWSGSRGTSFGPHIWHGSLGVLNYHTWKVQIYDTLISKEFLLFALRQLIGFIEGQAHGAAALVHVQKWEMESFRFPLPPTKDEQNAIVTALSDMDALLNTLDALIAKKRLIKQGVMQELLTGKKRLSGFSGNWELKKLGDLGVFRGGNGFPIIYQGATDGIYPLYKVSDMNNEGNTTFMISSNNWISEATKKQIGANSFPKNTIVFAKIGAAIFLERKKILSQESCVDNNMMGFILDENLVYLRFIHYLFLNIQLGKLVSATALPSLNGKDIAALTFGIPPLPEQTAIAEILSDMDAEISALEQKREKTRLLKQGMMQELLTGRIRII